MANPATTLARTTQDKRIPELDTLPPGTNPSTLSVPVYNPATDKTHQSPIGGPVPNTNAVPGGAKVVQYRDSRLYGVPAGALTLDRLGPLTIAPGTLATVDNPADTPLTVTKPPQQYVATVVAAGTAGAVLVPRYIGAVTGDTVPILWQAVVTAGGGALALRYDDYPVTTAGAQVIPLMGMTFVYSVSTLGINGTSDPLGYGNGFTFSAGSLQVLAAANLASGAVVQILHNGTGIGAPGSPVITPGTTTPTPPITVFTTSAY